MYYDEIKFFKISLRKKTRKYPQVYEFPSGNPKYDEECLEKIDNLICSGDYKDLKIESIYDIPELQKCSDMGLSKFTNYYSSIYDKLNVLIELTDKDELSALIKGVTDNLDELVDIVKKGEYHFYKNTYLYQISEIIYHKEIESYYDEDEYEYKKEPDVLIDDGYLEIDRKGTLKFFDKKILADKYKQRQQQLRQIS